MSAKPTAEQVMRRGDITDALLQVRDLQRQFLNALYDLEITAEMESINPATDFRRVTVEQVAAKQIPATLIYTLLFSHANGNDVWVYTTEGAARKRLSQVARDNWDGENDAPEEAPEDDDEAIEWYFYDGRVNESYQLEAARIEGPVIAQQPLGDGFIGPCVNCATQCIDGGEGTVFCPKCKKEEAKRRNGRFLVPAGGRQ